MTPAYDEIASYQRSKSKGSLASTLGDVPELGAGNSSVGVKVVLTLVVLALVGTAGWAAYLHQQLQQSLVAQTAYVERISDLERRLSITDENMSESSVAMKVKVKEMDSEIRKLWDNVWKKSKQRLAEHDSKLKSLERGVKRSDSFANTVKQQLSANSKIVSGLSSQLTQVEAMQTTLTTNQQKLSQQESQLESNSDKLNRLNSDVGKLGKRIEDNEEWIESINGFRRQVNRDLGVLKQRIGQLQAGGANASSQGGVPAR